MKKLVVAALVAVSFAASAVEVGVVGVDQTTPNPNRYGYGVTVGESFGSYNLTAGLSRFYRESDDQTRVSLVASKDVYKAGPVAFSGRVGYAYLNNQTAVDGSALTVGVGADVPVTKTVSAGIAIDRQYGQSRVNQFDGNVITAGVKVRF